MWLFGQDSETLREFLSWVLIFFFFLVLVTTSIYAKCWKFNKQIIVKIYIYTWIFCNEYQGLLDVSINILTNLSSIWAMLLTYTICKMSKNALKFKKDSSARRMEKMRELMLCNMASVTHLIWEVSRIAQFLLFT